MMMAVTDRITKFDKITEVNTARWLLLSPMRNLRVITDKTNHSKGKVKKANR